MTHFQQVDRQLNDLLENLGQLVHVVDTNDAIVFANTLWLEALKRTPDDLPATFATFIAPEYKTRYAHAIQQIQTTQQPTDVELVIDNQQGYIVILACHLVPHIKDETLQAIISISRDITNATDAYAELDRMFRLSHDMLGIIDAQGKFLRLNPAWERTLGYPVAQLIGKSYLDFVHPDDVATTRAINEQIINGQHKESFQNRYRATDGGYRWLSWNPVFYPNRKHIYFVARDITDQKHTTDQLEVARAQLNAILDNSGVAIYFKDRFGRYQLVNEELASLLDQTPREIVGKYDEDVLPAPFADAIIQHDRQVIQTGVSQQFEEFFKIDDEIHTFLSTKFPIFDAHDEVIAICAIVTDITYRKLTEMQLSLRNQAIEFSPSAISIADARLPDMPLIYTNPAFEDNTGYSTFEAIGKNCRFLQGDDRDQPEIAIIKNAITNSQTCTVTLRNYRKDGTLFYNELRLAPIFDEDGTLTHYVGISTDVTNRVLTQERIRMQNQELLQTNRELAQIRAQTEMDAERILKQNQELLEINRALAIARKQAEDATRLKSQFLATMSHELRTPLNAIIGYTEIQLAGMTGALTDEQGEYQRRVLANAEHLLGLINDVLDIAKIEAGRMELVNKTLDIHQWVEEVVAQTIGLANNKDLTFETFIDDRMPPRIIIDPARLKQVAINLLSNAFKFTNQGTVRLQIRRHGNEAWKLIVSDTGIGIPSHMQETIFEEFRQVDSSSQRKQGGTGLGLSIVRKLCLMMGGNVRVQSQMEHGTTFTIILPLVTQDNHSIPPVKEENTPHD